MTTVAEVFINRFGVRYAAQLSEEFNSISIDDGFGIDCSDVINAADHFRFYIALLYNEQSVEADQVIKQCAQLLNTYLKIKTEA